MARAREESPPIATWLLILYAPLLSGNFKPLAFSSCQLETLFGTGVYSFLGQQHIHAKRHLSRSAVYLPVPRGPCTLL